jgi:hypothetical protein
MKLYAKHTKWVIVWLDTIKPPSGTASKERRELLLQKRDLTASKDDTIVMAINS